MFLGQITSPDFLTAFDKLSNLEYFKSTPVIYRLVQLGKLIAEENKKFHETRQILIEKFGDKDADGKQISKTLPNGTVEYSIVTHSQEFANELNILGSIEVVIESFAFSDFKQYNPNTKEEYDAPLSPRDIINLGDLIIF